MYLCITRIPTVRVSNTCGCSCPTGSVLKDVHQGLLNYQITDTSISWARIFGMMERAKESLHVEDYSVGQTTLEQVLTA